MRTCGFGKRSASGLGPVRAQQELVADVPINLCVLACDSSRADDSHFHWLRDPERDSDGVDHTKAWSRSIAHQSSSSAAEDIRAENTQADLELKQRLKLGQG
jgi:hypothetical protein